MLITNVNDFLFLLFQTLLLVYNIAMAKGSGEDVSVREAELKEKLSNLNKVFTNIHVTNIFRNIKT